MSAFLFTAIMIAALIGVPVTTQAIYKMRPGVFRVFAITGTVAGAAAAFALAIQFYLDHMSITTNYAFVALFGGWLISMMACAPLDGTP